MESTFTGNGQAERADADEQQADIADATRRSRNAGNQEINGLMAGVQDLLNRLAHIADPEIARLRSKVEEGLRSVKKTVADRAEEVPRRIRGAMDAGDGYVRNRPWQAIGVAAVAGLAVGFLIGRR